MKLLVIYGVHSGRLYGTERMALATLAAISHEVDVELIAPPGPVHEEATARGIPSKEIAARYDLTGYLADQHRRRDVVFLSTRVSDSVAFEVVRKLPGRRTGHLHVIHGGSTERASYGRKRVLPWMGVRLLAVSDYVRTRLMANGVHENAIEVVENFIDVSRCRASGRPRRMRGRPRVLVISRLDPQKRIDLLMDALDRDPRLANLDFDILGSGSDVEVIKARASRHRNVHIHGFVTDVSTYLLRADAYVHLCPTEPFGISILEAQSHGLPTLVPDAGGASSLVTPEESGLHFRADDSRDLANRLLRLGWMGDAERGRIVSNAARLLDDRFSVERGGKQYIKEVKEALK